VARLDDHAALEVLQAEERAVAALVARCEGAFVAGRARPAAIGRTEAALLTPRPPGMDPWQ